MSQYIRELTTPPDPQNGQHADLNCTYPGCMRETLPNRSNCAAHTVQIYRELPAEAIAECIPVEVVAPVHRNVVTRFPNSRTIMDQEEPLFDKLDADDWAVVRKCLLALVVIGAFVAWAWWRQ